MGCILSKETEPRSAPREKQGSRSVAFRRCLRTTYKRADGPSNALRTDKSLSYNSNHDRYRFSVRITETNVMQRSSSGKDEVWEIGDTLGRGGYGEVVLQTRKSSRPESICLRAVKSIQCPTQKRMKKKYITRELDALIALKAHPDRFVDFHGWYQDDPGTTIYIAMEYHSAGDLHRYIKDNPTRIREQGIDIITQILQALDIMHSLGISHRDLKPKNILVASPSPLKLKLADFGISKSTSSTSHSPLVTQGIGSAWYMAPEMYPTTRSSRRAVEYTEAVDIWALGAITHEVCTGSPPFCIPITGHQGSPNTTINGTDESRLSNTSETSNSFIFDTKAFWAYEGNPTSFPIEPLVSAGAPETLMTFIPYLMAVDPKQRPTAATALSHSWLSGIPEPTATLVRYSPPASSNLLPRGSGGRTSYPRDQNSPLAAPVVITIPLLKELLHVQTPSNPLFNLHSPGIPSNTLFQ